jgi:hypothetical protein
VDVDVVILDGLPVTAWECTLADLLAEPEADVTIVADALHDALTSSSEMDVPSLTGHLQRHAHRLGHADGVSLYQHLRLLTQVDEERLRELTWLSTSTPLCTNESAKPSALWLGTCHSRCATHSSLFSVPRQIDATVFSQPAERRREAIAPTAHAPPARTAVNVPPRIAVADARSRLFENGRSHDFQGSDVLATLSWNHDSGLDPRSHDASSTVAWMARGMSLRGPT